MKIIESYQDIENLPPKTKVLCLFSGGLDSCYLVCYLAHKLKLDVTALYVNVGDDENKISRLKNLRQHIAKIVELDRTDEFCHQFIRPALLAQCWYGRRHPISSSLSRPHFVQVAVEYQRFPEFG